MFDMRSAKEISPSGDWDYGFYLDFEDEDWTIVQKNFFEILSNMLQGKDYQLLTPKTHHPPYQITLRLNIATKAAQIRDYLQKNCNLDKVPQISPRKHISVQILSEDGFNIDQLTQAVKDGFKIYIENGNVRKKDGSKGFAKILIRDRN